MKLALDYAPIPEGPLAASILYVAPDGDVLMLRRSNDEPNYGGHWAMPGGKAEPGETAEACAVREAEEELGVKVDGPLKLLDIKPTPTGMHHVTYVQPVTSKFTPTLNDEHSGYAWVPVGALPEPVHPGVAATLEARAGLPGQPMAAEAFTAWAHAPAVAQDAAPDMVALDRASVRRIDDDGHMHVELTPISKANVCPYYGREIPNASALGLDPDKVYHLLRAPDELERGAATFAGKPLLLGHTPVSADSHPDTKVVGTIGRNVVFKAPYLMADLTIWKQQAIDGINKDDNRQISCGYRYTADMTPGVYGGVPYDGVMRNIIGNHVALVKEGRAGPDVLVGDQAPLVTVPNSAVPMNATTIVEGMTRILHSGKRKRKKSASNGKNIVPKTGADNCRKPKAKDSLVGQVAKKVVTNTVQSARKEANAQKRAYDHKPKEMKMAKLSLRAAVAKGALIAHVGPMLAADAAIDFNPLLKGITAKNWAEKRPGLEASVTQLLQGKLAADAKPNVGAILMALDEDEDEDEDANEEQEAEDEDMDDEDDDVTEDEADKEDEDDTEAKRKAEDAKLAKKFVTKTAMDAAINAAVKAAVKRTREEERAIRQAEDAVRPVVGNIAMAHDSASDVYRTALGVMGVDVAGVDPTAYKTIFEVSSKAAAKTAGHGIKRIAVDSKPGGGAKTSFTDMYPAAKPVRTA